MTDDEALGRLQAIHTEIEKSTEDDHDDPGSILTIVRGMADPDQPFLPI